MERAEPRSQRRRIRRKREGPEDGRTTASESRKGRHIFGSATAERFVIRRTKRAPREPIRQQITPDDAPSFIGHGVSGRARYLFDSILRLSRSNNHTLLGMIVTMLVFVCFILLILDRLVGKCMRFYEYRMRSQASPFKLISDVLIKYSAPSSWTGKAAAIIRENSLWMDAVLRNCASFIVPIVWRAFF